MGGCSLALLIAAGFTWCNCAAADVNSTRTMEVHENLCHQKGEKNCTEATQSEHFTKCEEKYTNYCVEGSCRFFVSEQQPSCVCKSGFVGSRCELVDILFQKEDRNHIIIGLILALAIFIILIVIIFICVHRSHRKRKERNKREEVETLNSGPQDETPSRNVETSVTGCA
ncbi:probetacellulin isoform X1 [Callorhinchus milii]|nr:probetacellulin isoform X1 [Callorhinchus milii]